MPTVGTERQEVPPLFATRVPRDKVRAKLPEVQYRQGIGSPLRYGISISEPPANLGLCSQTNACIPGEVNSLRVGHGQ